MLTSDVINSTETGLVCDMQFTAANIVTLNKAGVNMEQALIITVDTYANKRQLMSDPAAIRRAFRQITEPRIPLSQEHLLEFSATCLVGQKPVLFRIKITL
jgi:hypothetical protein